VEAILRYIGGLDDKPSDGISSNFIFRINRYGVSNRLPEIFKASHNFKTDSRPNGLKVPAATFNFEFLPIAQI